MKIVLVCLNFYFVFNLISALDTSNASSHQQANNESNIYHSASHLQGLADQQQQHTHSHNATIADQHADAINNRDDRVIHPRFRPWFQTHRHNEPEIPLLEPNIADSNSSSSSILKNNAQLNQPPLADGRAITNTTKSSGLLQILTPKSQTRGNILFGDSYFLQRLRAFVFGHQHDQTDQHDESPSPTRSNIKTGL